MLEVSNSLHLVIDMILVSNSPHLVIDTIVDDINVFTGLLSIVCVMCVHDEATVSFWWREGSNIKRLRLLRMRY